MNLRKQQIIALCKPKGKFSSELAIALADILRAEARIHEAAYRDQRAKNCFAKALHIYKKSRATPHTVLRIHISEKIRILTKKIDQHSRD